MPTHVSEEIKEPISIVCRDGFRLGGHLWKAQGEARGTVLVNAATGVLARYYHPYARFLAEHGFTAITYDYRGIGASRPAKLRGSGIRWRDWGELDFDAVVRWARARDASGHLQVAGHSIGGFLPGFAESATELDRILNVSGAYAFWNDYSRASRVRRAQLFAKWHIAMPAVTALLGYFPGKRLGWLEDLPAGVALEWSYPGKVLEARYPRDQRARVREHFAAVRAPILAVSLTDDELASERAIRRGLAYYLNSPRQLATIAPTDFGHSAIGHFGLFHSRHREGFWTQTLTWLRDGENPWPERSTRI